MISVPRARGVSPKARANYSLRGRGDLDCRGHWTSAPRELQRTNDETGNQVAILLEAHAILGVVDRKTPKLGGHRSMYRHPFICGAT